MKLFFTVCILVACFKSKKGQVVPVGQLFVGDQVKEGCTVQLRSETPIRIMRGCYRSRIQLVEGCELVKYHREVATCCQSSRAEFLRWLGGVEAQPCYYVQEVYLNYCVRAQSYTLEEGCTDSEPCGNEFDDQITEQDLQSVHIAERAEDCLKLDVRRYKGSILSGCRRIESSVTPELRCIRIKRNLPYKSCCGYQELREKFQANVLPCSQYIQTEAEYCFSVPSESLSFCSPHEAVPCE